MQVFDIEDMGGKSREGTAVVARPRDCTMCRLDAVMCVTFMLCNCNH
jgi:hypothetical protein